MTTRSWKTLALAAACLGLALAACTDPTVAPKTGVTSANFFNDPSSYKEFLAKIYGGLALAGQQGGDGSADIQGIDGGFSQYMRLYWELEELPTDEAVIAWGDLGLQPLNTQTWDAGNPFVRAMYYRVFFQVSMANEFLRQTTDAELTSRGVSPQLRAQIQTYRAEARFMRALSYWHGLDFFGNIPLVTENDPIGATPPKQATRADVYAYVVSELQAIENDLPPDGDPASYGRATPDAARMLLAELYLNDSVYTGTANWSGALNEAAAVINSGAYRLDSNYRRIFSADNNTSPEIIFAVPEDGIHTQTYGSTNFLIHASCGNKMNNNTYGIDGCWWGLRLKPQADSLFAAGDARAAFIVGSPDQTLGVADLSTFADGYAAPKFTNMKSTGGTGSNTAFVDTDFPIFRLGEAYLIYAEAHLRGGGGTDAMADSLVNALQFRAFGDTTHNVHVSNGTLTLPFLLAERGRELLWEAHRRTDLVRFGLFTGGTYLWAWKGNAPDGTATSRNLDLYPIPATELVANPNLKQNPGY